MREIKFRGKRIDNGEWVYGSLLITKTTTKHYWIAPPRPILHGAMLGDSLFEVDPKTIGEFASRKDKNGVEIYEGDIVKIGNHPYCLNYDDGDILDVKWCPYLTGWSPFCDDNSDYDGIRANVHTTIIGNIHENPELVELIKTWKL